MFLHMPNWNDVSKDIVSIGDGIADISHSNGVACEWAASVQHLALLYVQQDQIITFYPSNGTQSQKCIKLQGITMGGTGHGSKLKTRISYIPV